MITKEVIPINEKTIELTISQIDSDDDSIIIFLPGWKMNADAPSCTSFAEELSKRGKVLTISTTLHSAENFEDTLETEAQAIATYLHDNNIDNIIIIGHSRGCHKALYLTHTLHESGKTVHGCGLISGVGLYDQFNSKTFQKLTFDHLFDLIVWRDIVPNLLNDMWTWHIYYPYKILNELEEMAEVNKHFDTLPHKMIIISNENDSVSLPSLIPEGENRAILTENNQGHFMIFNQKEAIVDALSDLF